MLGGRMRRRVAAPAIVDPVTLSLSGYWEQRGDVNDYSQTDTDGGGPDAAGTWEDRSGSSRPWTQTTPASRPLTGTAVDGKPRILLESSSYWGGRLDNASTLAAFGTAAELAVTMMVRIPTIASASWAAQASPMLWADISGWFGICYGKDAGVDYIGVVAYDSGWRAARAPYVAGTWTEVNVRHAGGNLMIALDAPPALDPGAGVRKSVACGNVGQVSHVLRTGHGGIGAASACEVLSWAMRQTLTDPDFETISAWRKGLYPAAGLPA